MCPFIVEKVRMQLHTKCGTSPRQYSLNPPALSRSTTLEPLPHYFGVVSRFLLSATIDGTLARTSTKLVETVRYAEIILRVIPLNDDQRAESFTLISSSFCFRGSVHHCQDSINCGTAFPKSELFLR